MNERSVPKKKIKKKKKKKKKEKVCGDISHLFVCNQTSYTRNVWKLDPRVIDWLRQNLVNRGNL